MRPARPESLRPVLGSSRRSGATCERRRKHAGLPARVRPPRDRVVVGRQGGTRTWPVGGGTLNEAGMATPRRGRTRQGRSSRRAWRALIVRRPASAFRRRHTMPGVPREQAARRDAGAGVAASAAGRGRTSGSRPCAVEPQRKRPRERDAPWLDDLRRVRRVGGHAGLELASARAPHAFRKRRRGWRWPSAVRAAEAADVARRPVARRSSPRPARPWRAGDQARARRSPSGARRWLARAITY